MWNGSYKDSKYKETDNLVNDVLENDGTLTHEETSDGYTHETKDRGSYISDDYYCPNDKGKHDHYELRSSGEVLKNGKPI